MTDFELQKVPKTPSKVEDKGRKSSGVSALWKRALLMIETHQKHCYVTITRQDHHGHVGRS